MLRFSPQAFVGMPVLRLVGYGLLILSLLDLIEIFVPLRLGNPTWQLETIGFIFERVPVPLLGMALVFYGEEFERSRIEAIGLKYLSWVLLLLGLLFFLMVPWVASSTLQINQQNDLQVASQYNEQISRIIDVENQVKQTDPRSVKALLQQLGTAVNAETQNLGQLPPPALKTRLLEQLVTSRKGLQAEAAQEQKNRRVDLYKKAVKWILGCIITGVLFISFWRNTDWARRNLPKKR